MLQQLSPSDQSQLMDTLTDWAQVTVSTETDVAAIEESVCRSYRCVGKPEPQHLIWLNGPLQGVIASWIVAQGRKYLDRLELPSVWKPLQSYVWPSVDPQGALSLRPVLRDQVLDKATQVILQELGQEALRQLGAQGDEATRQRLTTSGQIWSFTSHQVETELNATLEAEFLDHQHYRVSKGIREIHRQVFGVDFWRIIRMSFLKESLGLNLGMLEGILATCRACGWWWAFPKVAILCPRPTRIRLDAEGQLHGEGEPAIAYARSNLYVYAHHGVFLPQKYWDHPAQWRSEWLLEEDNVELKRVLIQALGYGRILQELGAERLDSWREYELFQIPQAVDVEPIRLLQMTCPSTSFIHVLRVPPDLGSARQAVTWCNWGVDPGTFATEA